MIGVWRGVLLLIGSNALVTGLALALGAASPVRQVTYDARPNGNSEIFLLDVEHGLKFNLTQHEGEDSRPVWSPDGRRIAFESWRDGTRAIYVMDGDGRNLRRLTAHTDASEYAPEWTPDGEAILFHYYKRPDSAIFRVRPDGSDLQKIEPANTVQPPAAPDRVVSTQYVDDTWSIFVTQGNLMCQLTHNNIPFREPPQWSADGRLIAFLWRGDADKSEIYVMDGHGCGLRQVTMDGMFKSNLHWRP